MDRKFIPIREKTVVETLNGLPPDPFDTGEATKKQIFTYIFSDFIRGGMIVGFLFLDILIISQLWYFIPDFVSAMHLLLLYFWGVNFILLYYVIAILFLELYVASYEVNIYRRVWKRIKEIALIS